MAKEINLVPDVKNEFIKALKFRNLVFFLCIIIASGSLLMILIFLTIAGGQQGFIDAKQTTIAGLSQKITDYGDLSDFITIRDQVNNLSAISDNKTVMSRLFNVLSTIIPSRTTNADYISVSELTVNLAGDLPTFSFDAQANAGTEPYIDYRVLESFKKSMQYMRYDYGEYLDKYDATIPAYCMIERGEDGAILRDSTKGYYAFWLVNGEGCNPSAPDEIEEEVEETVTDSAVDTENTGDADVTTTTTTTTTTTVTTKYTPALEYDLEDYQGQQVVRIWRTPQYTEWYKSDPKEGEAYMDLEGEIHNMPHFKSSCITYSGTLNTPTDNNETLNAPGTTTAGESTVTWTATNDTCKLVPDSTGEEQTGIVISSSSNGRDADEQLVLRFAATVSFAPEVFSFKNHHLIALPPAGRRNVTDSYSQVQSMFAERASDCRQDDTDCITTPTSGDVSEELNMEEYTWQP